MAQSAGQLFYLNQKYQLNINIYKCAEGAFNQPLQFKNMK
jgi:hypothetical protein